MKKEKKIPSQERLRDIMWEVGTKYPIPFTSDYIALCMVTPHLGHVHWHVSGDAVNSTKWEGGEAYNNAPLVVRVYDVTDVIFDGFNAHMFIDIEVQGFEGHYYFNVPQLARNYIAEIGLRGWDGSFRYIARSNNAFLERDRPSGDYQVGGLFVGGALKRKFPVENIFDAQVYEHMNQELAGIDREEALSAAVVFIGMSQAALDSPLGNSIRNFPQKIKKFGGDVQTFTPVLEGAEGVTDESLISKVQAISETTVKQVTAAHKKTPFHLIHCHDWYSSKVGLAAAKKLNLPLVLSLHSTEYERTQGYEMHSLASKICEWEKEGVQGADLVIVPHSSTRQQVINLYGASPDKVVIVPDVFVEHAADMVPDSAGVRNWLDIDQSAPLVLFAGEMSHAAGADLLVDALPSVCGNYGTVQFVFAGDGPLRGELEARAAHTGIGHRCRFLGDVSGETFESLLLASDFVVIPARTWQDEGLAQMAIDCGKPVLTTHQAGINCVAHGQNGLVTYDNPGSITWGVQELLANPLGGNMLRLVAKKKANTAISLENIVAQHYMYYEITFKHFQGGKNHA